MKTVYQRQTQENIWSSSGSEHRMCTDLALVDGDGPGQFEWQLLSAQVDPTTRLKHPALWLQHLCDAAQETHTWESCGNKQHWARSQGGRQVCFLKSQTNHMQSSLATAYTGFSTNICSQLGTDRVFQTQNQPRRLVLHSPDLEQHPSSLSA